MNRLPCAPRPDWQAQLEQDGIAFHSMGGVYWDERVCYRFSSEQVDLLEAATETLHALCLEAVDRIVRSGRFEPFGLPAGVADWIASSWRRQEPHLYGRFDLAWTGAGAPKMLEYNADTPTALVEASVAQWRWQQALHPEADQFNSIHEKLIARWGEIPRARSLLTHFAAVGANDEDQTTLQYLADTAIQAGHQAVLLPIEAIGWDSSKEVFVDEACRPIEQLFKLYPTEWLVREAFAGHLLEDRR